MFKLSKKLSLSLSPAPPAHAFAFQNIKFMIAHIRLINSSKSAMELLNDQIAGGIECKTTSSLADYALQLTNANNFTYSFQLFTHQFAREEDQNVSVLDDLIANLVDQTAYLLQSLSSNRRAVDAKNLDSLFMLSRDFCYDQLASCAANYIRMLVENFKQDLIDLECIQSALSSYETLSKMLVFEGVEGVRVAFGQVEDKQLADVLEGLKGQFCSNLSECLDKAAKAAKAIVPFKADEYEDYYERTEQSLKLLENYASLLDKISTDPLCKDLPLEKRDRLAELRGELKSHGVEIQRSFIDTMNFIDCSSEETEKVDKAKQAVQIYKEVRFASQFEKCWQQMPAKMLQSLDVELKETLELLEEKIDGLVRCELLSQLPEQLGIAKVLGDCEPAFADLYGKYNNAVKDAKKALYDKCLGKLMDFEALKECVDQFSESEVLDRMLLGQLREKLNSQLERDLRAALDIEGFEEIAVGLKSLENVGEARAVRQGFVEDLSELEDEVKGKLNGLVVAYVAETQDLVAGLQVSEAEEKISRLSDMLKWLNKLEVIDGETQSTIAELKCNQQELALVDSFQDMELSECLERAADMHDSLAKFPQSLEDVNKIIIGKFKETLAHTSGSSGLLELGELSEQLAAVPEDLKSKLDKLVSEQLNKLHLEQEFLFNEAETLLLKFIKHPQNQKNFDLKGQYDRMVDISHMADSEDLNGRVSEVNEKLSALVAGQVAAFDSSLENMEVVGIRNQMSVIRFVMETNSLLDDGSYGLMKARLVDKIEAFKAELTETQLPAGEQWQERKRLQFDQFYEALNGRLQVLLDAARLFQEFFEEDEELNLLMQVEACVAFLDGLVQDEWRRAQTGLESVIESGEDCDAQTTSAFIVSFYNLAAFEAKVPKARPQNGGGGGDYERKLQSMALSRMNEMLAEVQEDCSVEEAANTFKACKALGLRLFVFKERLDKALDRAINDFIKRAGGFGVIGKLGLLLKSDPVGSVIMSDHKVFESFHRSLFNRKTLSQDIEYVLRDLEGDRVQTEALRQAYAQFKATFDAIVEEYLAPVIDFDGLVQKLMDIVVGIEEPLAWGANLKRQLPLIIGHVFGLWTLLNATNYFEIQGESSDEQFHFIPHPAQVVAIFRMLGLGYSSSAATSSADLDLDLDLGVDLGLAKNLVQIGTGEGKSVTLAITASTLALFGMHTYCVCYSSYLSQRDYSAFEALFQRLQLVQRVNYGTFNKICESMLNRNGDLRKKVESFIWSNEIESSGEGADGDQEQRRRILLIDEVDVFFSKEFYGNRYQPSLSLAGPALSALISLVWQAGRASGGGGQLDELVESDEFKACVERLGADWQPLLVEALKDMLYELGSFQTGHEYIVQEDRIGYRELDTAVFDVSHGYKTLFAYLLENESGRISDEALASNVSLLVRLGCFSYAEIPNDFDSILGCSGTLSTLSAPEQHIIEQVYGIRLRTTVPSVYGRNNLRFHKQDNVQLEADENWRAVLAREIRQRLVGQNVGTRRAVFVVFETGAQLQAFLDAHEYQSMRPDTLVLTETANSAEKKRIVDLASSSGQVTFFTKIFGRGTDFKVHDQIVSVNGGVHVIQTFLSEELSEEIQIKGRTARQGENGSFSMVIPVSSLDKFQIQPEDLLAHQDNVYDYLNQKRCHFFEQKYAENVRHVQAIQQKHADSVAFLASMSAGDKEAVRAFLLEQNRGKSRAAVQASRTLVLIDATASMGHLLDKTKRTLGDMFERVRQVLAAQALDTASFQMKLAVYRNYNCAESQLLQQSSWENRPENLVDFLEKVYATGGWGNEAVEVGLWLANQEHNLSQVILIGDAAANTPNEVLAKRRSYRERWDGSGRYAEPVFCESELGQLVDKAIPVHAFYLQPRARQNFEAMAAATGGKTDFLDIDSEDASEKLTNLVNIQVLNNIGGDELVEVYRNTYNAF